MKSVTAGVSASSAPLAEAQRAFCARLQAARERSGVSLADIAASTKISVRLLADLEGGDLSRWPKGIFRRSFLRDYLTALGLPTEARVAEFVRLFPDDELQAPAGAGGAAPAPPSRPALQARQDDSAPWRRPPVPRLLAAVLEVAAVLVLSVVCARLIEASAWATTTVVALGYYSVGSAWFGGSFAARSMRPEGPSRPLPRRPPNAPVIRIRIVR